MNREEWLKSLSVGDEVYIYDENHMVYEKNASGKSFGGPIYREYFVRKIITKETTKSWMVENWIKASKKSGEYKNERSGIDLIYGAEEVEEKIYVHDNAWRLGDAVRRCNSADKLRRIKEILES